MHSVPRATRALLCLVAWVFAAGCGAQSPPPHAKRQPKAGTVSLPPVPNLNPPQVPLIHPDGAYSVRGILGADRKQLIQAIKVRGFVAAITPCALTETKCKPAPHLYLCDQADGLGRRLLVGGERDLDARGLKVGAEATLDGRLTTLSPDGVYFAPAGLLLLLPLPPAGPSPPQR